MSVYEAEARDLWATPLPRWGVYANTAASGRRWVVESTGEADARRIAAALNACRTIADYVLDGEEEGDGETHETTIDQAFEELAAVVDTARHAMRCLACDGIDGAAHNGRGECASAAPMIEIQRD